MSCNQTWLECMTKNVYATYLHTIAVKQERIDASEELSPLATTRDFPRHPGQLIGMCGWMIMISEMGLPPRALASGSPAFLETTSTGAYTFLLCCVSFDTQRFTT